MPARFQIYVGNVHYDLTEQDLLDLFKESGNFLSMNIPNQCTFWGEVETVRIIRKKKSGKSAGYGFVTFNSRNGVEKALEKNGTDLRDRKILVREAHQ